VSKNGNGKGGGIPFPPASVGEYKATLERYLEALRPDGRGQVRKRALRDALRWGAWVDECEVWQERPWTAVNATVVAGGLGYLRQKGFSKVRAPDEWDPVRGEQVAIGKAVCAAVRDALNALDPEQEGAIAEELASALDAEIEKCRLEDACLAPPDGQWRNPYRYYQVGKIPF